MYEAQAYIYMHIYMCLRDRDASRVTSIQPTQAAHPFINVVEEMAGLIRKRKYSPCHAFRASHLGAKQGIASHRQSVLLWSTSDVPGRLSWDLFQKHWPGSLIMTPLSIVHHHGEYGGQLRHREASSSTNPLLPSGPFPNSPTMSSEKPSNLVVALVGLSKTVSLRCPPAS